MAISKDHFNKLRVRKQRQGQMLAWKDAVKTFMKFTENRAYTAGELAQLLRIEVGDVYIILHDLCYRNVTRKDIYFAWGR